MFSLKPVDSIILDIDGTIWNTTPVVSVAWNKSIDEAGFSVSKVTPEILKKEFGKPMDVIARDLWPELTFENQKILLELCCKNEHTAIENNDNDITFPTVVDTIKELSKSFKLYIVSNCQSGYIELTMKKTGITEFISDFECFGDTGKSKGENIKLIIKRNNLINPVYVGDTQGDLEACKEADIPFIFASYGFGNPESYVYKLEQFSDLKKLY